MEKILCARPAILFVSRKLLHEFVTSLSRGVLSLHEKLVREQKSSLTQTQALQVMFDLKFMSSILLGRGEDDEFSNRREQVVDALESCVDPFDLDVFSPHITTNLNRQLQRCGVCVEIGSISTYTEQFPETSFHTKRAREYRNHEENFR